jgi:hypothetical protein
MEFEMFAPESASAGRLPVLLFAGPERQLVDEVHGDGALPNFHLAGFKIWKS